MSFVFASKPVYVYASIKSCIELDHLSKIFDLQLNAS